MNGEVPPSNSCAPRRIEQAVFLRGFADLDELASAVVDDIADEVRRATLAAFAAAADRPLEEQARASVEAVVRTLVRDPRRARVLLGGVAATLNLRRHRKRMMGRLTAVLVGSPSPSVHGVELEPDPLAQITPAFVVGGTAEAVLAFLDGTAKLTLESWSPS